MMVVLVCVDVVVIAMYVGCGMVVVVIADVDVVVVAGIVGCCFNDVGVAVIRAIDGGGFGVAGVVVGYVVGGMCILVLLFVFARLVMLMCDYDEVVVDVDDVTNYSIVVVVFISIVVGADNVDVVVVVVGVICCAMCVVMCDGVDVYAAGAVVVTRIGVYGAVANYAGVGLCGAIFVVVCRGVGRGVWYSHCWYLLRYWQYLCC